MAAAVSASQRHNSLPEFFEFSTAAFVKTDMCIADDVIFHGKLLPLLAVPPCQYRRTQTHVSVSEVLDHRRSNSLDSPSGFWSSKGTAAAEYRKLRRVSDSELNARPVDLLKPKPRWYLLVFGSVKVPAAMEMKEIRVRQGRRSSPPKEERGPWKLLRSLSCKGMEAVVVS